MSYIAKQNPNPKPYPKNSFIRKPHKHQISHHFHDDLPLLPFNPFSEQLTPWNGSSKLQASINLLAKQNNSKFISKHHSIDHEPTVENIVSGDTVEYATLAFRSSYQKPSSHSNSYTCPRLKVVNQSAKGEREQKDEAKRYLFNKKPATTNKNVKKIANLTIEWDQEIVYNPEKKHFQQQSLKRKILRQFSHTRNQNRNQLAKKDQKSPQKLLKFEFRNNKIHGKQVSVFEFKKKELSLQMNRNNSKKDKSLYETPHLQALIQNNQNNSTNELKVNTLDFKPHSSGASHEIDSHVGPQTKQAFRSDKFNFRTSLKSRLPIPHAKKGLDKDFKNKQRLTHQQAFKSRKDKQALNRITLEFQQSIKEDKFTPLEVLSRTSPHFFRKEAI